MSEHTQGKLRLASPDDCIGHFRIHAVDDPKLIAVIGNAEDWVGVLDEWRANANRLIACWNACAGISTEALEGASVRALVDAVGKIVKHMESRGMQHWKVCKQSRSALAPFLKGTSDEQ